MRKTSIDTYNQIKNCGLLSKMRFMVYECIYQNGPMTQSECWKNHLEKSHGIKSGQNITPRFAELKNLGVICENSIRPCSITGRMCIEWDVTNNLPVEFKRVSKDQIIKELREEIEGLKKLVKYFIDKQPKAK